MAKINHFISTYSECFDVLGAHYDLESNPPKAVVSRFVHIFKDINDERLQGMIDYPLVEIILITFLAVLGGASTWSEIESFGNAKSAWLKKFIKLKNGIPSHDTFRRVFSLIDTDELQDATVSFLMQNLHAIKKHLPAVDHEFRHLCIDGKEQRGTGRKYDSDEKVRNLQTLHIYDNTNEICIYSEAIDEKTNEIPVAQKLLRGMALKGCIVTFDALHMQKETVSIITERNGLYVGGLKGNQSGLLEEASAYFEHEKHLLMYKEKGNYKETKEKAHGKIETRQFYLVRPTKKNRTIMNEWPSIKAFIMCHKKIEDPKTGAFTEETRYYASSSNDIELCSEAIREHWSVENRLHWQLDYSMREDENTTMDKKAFHNLSLINKMVLTLCKLMKDVGKKKSVRVQRKVFGWNFEGTLALLLYVFDEDAIEAALRSVKA